MTNLTCSLATTVYCDLEHPTCFQAGECAGHSQPVCDQPASYRLESEDALQYACRDHIDVMLRRNPGTSVKPLAGRVP